MSVTAALAFAWVLTFGSAELPAHAFDRFAWLAGHWRGEGPAEAGGLVWHEEIWSPPVRLSMTGRSRSGIGERERFSEILEIRPGVGGAILLHVRPEGQRATTFRLQPSRRERELVFENPYHDYPQRIAYRREGDMLTATISLMNGSRPVTWTYRLQPPR